MDQSPITVVFDGAAIDPDVWPYVANHTAVTAIAQGDYICQRNQLLDVIVDLKQQIVRLLWQLEEHD